MAEFPALPIFTDAFIADTLHLSAAQTGGYLMLLMCAWRTKDCSLPNDDVRLAAFSRMDKRSWMANREVIMSFWALNSSGQWIQKRLIDERKHAEDKRDQCSLAGKVSALKKKGRHSTNVPTDVPTELQPPTLPTPYPLNAVGSSAADRVALGKRIGEVTGWNHNPSWFGNYSRLEAWLAEGWDADLDILPTVRRLMASKQSSPPTSLKYFERAIADSYATRTAPTPKGTAYEKTTRNNSRPTKTDRAKASIIRSSEALGFISGSGSPEEISEHNFSVFSESETVRQGTGSAGKHQPAISDGTCSIPDRKNSECDDILSSDEHGNADTGRYSNDH